MSKKVFFRVVGGIGNQLFIYFTGKALEKKGYEVIFDLSTGYFWDKYDRKPILQNIDLDIRKSNWLEILFFYFVKYFSSPILGFFLKEKTPNSYTDLSSFKSRYNFIEGYFQSPTYFNEFKGAILKSLSFNIIDNEEYLNYIELIEKSESVCIHVRTPQKTEKTLTKYQDELLDSSYYNQAIERIVKKTGENSVFFVFARDLSWAKENLPNGYKYIFIDLKQTNDLFEFITMTKCKSHIIANSTFSWWAAYISESDTVFYRNHDKLHTGVEGQYFPSQWEKI